MHILVVIPAWNVAPWIGQTLHSLQSQSHQDWTAVVVDDGSSDATAERVAASTDPRIRLVRQVNCGVSAARNRGVAEAESDAVMFLDGDDWLAPDALMRLATALEGSGADVAVGPWRYADAEGIPYGPVKSFTPSADVLARLVVRNLFVNGGHVLVRRRALPTAGWRSDLRYGEDWEYWCRVAGIATFASDGGREPTLFVRRRHSGAVLNLGAERSAIQPALDAIFANPDLAARFGAAASRRLRRRADAEADWVAGRELVRHGRAREGRRFLRRAVAAAPSFRRIVLLGAAHGLQALPDRFHGPFQRYQLG